MGSRIDVKKPDASVFHEAHGVNRVSWPQPFGEGRVAAKVLGQQFSSGAGQHQFYLSAPNGADEATQVQGGAAIFGTGAGKEMSLRAGFEFEGQEGTCSGAGRAEAQR